MKLSALVMQPNTTEVPMDYSLRAYVAILYKVPRMQVFIRYANVSQAVVCIVWDAMEDIPLPNI